MEDQSRPARILIVDDTLKNLQVLGTILKKEGYRINVAQNGVQAVNTAVKVLPDLILLDIMMPEMDGYACCRRLKAMPETTDIPVIFLTARTEASDVVKGFEAGGVDYVAKPFQAIELLARIRTHVDLARKTQKLKTLADRDGLTLIANRRRFDRFLENAWSRCIREQKPIALIMADIDWFKPYNDQYGHLQGDDCLKQVSRVLEGLARRAGDLVARYGGEEFAVILENTSLDAGISVGERMRRSVAELAIPHLSSPDQKQVTISVGVAAQTPKQGDESQNLIDAADKALYRAKSQGRNQVRAA